MENRSYLWVKINFSFLFIFMICTLFQFEFCHGSLYVDCSLSTSSSNCGTNASPCNNINETFHSSSFAGGEEIIIKSNSTCFGNHNFVCPFPALIRSELRDPTTVIFDGYSQRGFIILNNANCSFQGLTFQNFTLQNPYLQTSFGTVFYISNSTVNIDNCIIFNTTTPGGVGTYGAMYIQSGNVRVSNTKFIKNFGGVAGAVYIATNSSPVFNNCQFINNTVSDGGWAGAVSPEDQSTPLFENCLFDGNSATFGGAIDDGTAAKSIFNNCIFTRNSASYGGVYYAFGNTLATFNNCTFSFNFASDSGGVAKIVGLTSPLFNRSTFYNNSAITGGAIAVYSDSTVEIQNSVFYNGIINGGDGGFVACNGGTTIIDNTYFFNAQGANLGGCISIEFGSTFNMTNSNFSNCNALSGGALFFGNKRFNIFSYVHSCRVENSSADSGGGGMMVQSSWVKIVDMHFSNNSSPLGGNIYLHRGGTLQINDSQIIGGNANYGGGIYQYDFNSALQISNSNFTQNVAYSSGSAIALPYCGTKAEFSNLYFISNSAESGTIFISKISYNTTNCFTNESTIYFENNQVSLYGPTFASDFSKFVLASPHPSSIFPGEPFSVTFEVEDYFGNVIQGNSQSSIPQIEIFGEGLNGISFSGSSSYANNSGQVNFFGITATGLPRTEGTIMYYSSPPTNEIYVNIQLSDCPPGYIGLQTQKGFICLLSASISKAAIDSICTVNGIFVILTIVIIIVLWIKRNDPVLVRAQVLFCELICLGALLCYISVFLWTTVSNATCVLRAWFLGIGLDLMLGNLILKEYRIYTIFSSVDAINPKSKLITNKTLLIGTAVIVGIESVLLILWTGISAPQVQTNTNLTDELVIFFCSSSESQIFLWIILGYKLVLIFIGAVIAFLSRNVPESYNESKYIAFSIYNFIITFVVVMPLLYTYTDQNSSFIIVSLGIIFFTSVSLGFLFVPKLYYSIFKRAIIAKLQSEINQMEQEISIKKRQLQMEISARSLDQEYGLSDLPNSGTTETTN